MKRDVTSISRSMIPLCVWFLVSVPCYAQSANDYTVPLDTDLTITVDNVLVQLFFDGVQVNQSTLPNYNNWVVADTVSLPGTVKLIALEARNVGYIAGVLASDGWDGILTNSDWKCIEDINDTITDWMMPTYDDSAWLAAIANGPNSRQAHTLAWIYVPGIDENANWIWTANMTASYSQYQTIFCRLTINTAPQLSVVPTFGPLAGRTLVTIKATDSIQLFNVANVYFGTSNLSSTTTFNNGALYLFTPQSSQLGPVSITMERFDGKRTKLYTLFTYKPNPTVTEISPTSHLTSGGTLVTISGTGMNSVAEPVIQLSYIVTRVSAATPEYPTSTTSNCTIKSSLFMICHMPRLNLPQDFDDKIKIQSDLSRGSIYQVVGRNGLDTADVYFGIIFDGFTQYKNISSSLPNLRFQFYSSPTISSTNDVISIQQGDPRILNIHGKNLARGARLVDYTVSIGDGICSNQQLLDNDLSCLPPRLPPTQTFNNSNTCTGNTMDITLSVGFKLYFYGCARYVDSPFPLALTIGLAAGGGGLLILILIIVIIICVCRHKGLCCATTATKKKKVPTATLR